MFAGLQAIAWHVPERTLGNDELAALSDSWTAAKIAEKTGILERRIAAPDECASDLAVAAAEKLFASGACRPQEVEFVLLCTQSPDYLLPTTACLIQDRLGIPTSAGALDINLGCSGYVYGLSLTKGLIETGQARNVLLLTADTYSKYLADDDLTVRTLFGDGATATLLTAMEPDDVTHAAPLGPFVFGTDGRGANNLIVRHGASRSPVADGERPVLRMDGPEIFAFTLQAVPSAIGRLLERSGLTAADIDLFVLHQANQFLLEHLRNRMKIPSEKFPIRMAQHGNTVSCTIPLVLADLQQEGRLHPGMTVMLVGFGVGYSWGATILRWSGS